MPLTRVRKYSLALVEVGILSVRMAETDWHVVLLRRGRIYDTDEQVWDDLPAYFKFYKARACTLLVPQA